MKKIAFTIFFISPVLTILSYSAYSQAILKFEAGYNFSLLGGQLSPYLNSMTYDPKNTPYVHGSWGKGGSFGSVLDYKFNKFIDLEFGIKYRYGSALDYKDTVSALTNTANDRLHFFVFSLGYIYKYGHGSDFVPYLGAGVNYGVDNNISNTETSSDTYGYTTIFNSTLSCKSVWGGYGELGAEYHLNSNFSFFGELRFDVLYLTPKKLYVSSEIQNGSDITTTLLPYQQETDYVTSLTHPFSQLLPLQQTIQSLPASSWGFNLGIAFNLGEKPKPAAKN